ncbi:MAG TPA: GntR family transcriptional regulator [Dictyoglomaceae bacterium]|nr:GntR family transcriptional regulator [Dictyoglomaceae bacterium]HOL39939.1 GntR family transcriptional regulator [Dictyoglomaceae bacterium]HOP95672.1 GntR family transcriptional regulator [Dictyoglomaceae bacterium]HPP16401.1 GntR family transcriptional regulator [Dictyoglomaceae bacterium]HPU43632.1 GntR family transcriptional regulator [Dictyoglomaceae bacterium]
MWVIEFDERTPIYIQIMDLIKKRIGRGDLKSGDKLPSVREMAEELKVNPNTVQKAYQELEREGIIFTLRGMGSFITQDSEKILDLKKVMVREIIAKFLKDVRELNFSKDEILSLLDKYWKESE